MGPSFPGWITVPTGLGKTATVILGWAWRRSGGGEVFRSTTPRRLAYCLPMRVLAEQTYRETIIWLDRLGLLAGKVDIQGGKVLSYDPLADPNDPTKIRVHLLMGGEDSRDWDAWPDRDAILIGTQDMLLSRALNRGYAMSRYRWPLAFGLLNTDCQWVMDEIQLMGSGLATTAQMQAFRRLLGSELPARSTWMSATADRNWVSTVDFDPAMDLGPESSLSPEDLAHPVVMQRLNARKRVVPSSTTTRDARLEAAAILEAHVPGARTLVVVNTVKRALAMREALAKKKPAARLVLIHSRFRPADRSAALEELLGTPPEEGTIIVATQVVEAGVDVSARILFTDLAPWASLVQRFGRCNRRGEFEDAHIYWFDADTSKPTTCLPYDPGELDTARESLQSLVNAAPAMLPGLGQSSLPRQVIRKTDLLDLFDTTPDLAGADVDISRWIRETDDHDMQVFWRDLGSESPGPQQVEPRRNELCSVPLGEVKKFIGTAHAWRWDALDQKWQRAQPRDVFPGTVLMLSVTSGGYEPHMGWTGNPRHIPAEVPPVERVAPERNDGDPDSLFPWLTLAEHTDRVASEGSRLMATLGLTSCAWAPDFTHACRWHDAGKAHPVFQASLARDLQPPMVGQVWAKSPVTIMRHERPGFRHELASGLAILLNGGSNLAAYLAASHHGKVRLGLRSLPHEAMPQDPQARFARGIWEGDALSSASLGGGANLPQTTLTLGFMEMGLSSITGQSWAERMLELLHHPDHGPFRLAFREGLLRVADWRGSAAGVSHG